MCALLTGSLGLGAYLFHGMMLERLGQRLSRTAHARVELGGLHGRLWPPAIVIEGLRLGQKTLTVDHVEARVRLKNGRPVVEHLRLVRPHLRLTVSNRDRRRHAEKLSTPGSRQRRRVLPAVELLDGAVDLRLGRLTVASRGIYLAPRPETRELRLVLGPTQIGLEDRQLLRVAATAVDLDPAAGYRPTRVASLGASLHLPEQPQSLIGLHRVTLSPSLDGYRLDLAGKTGGHRSGSFEATGQLDAALRPEEARVMLRDLDLAALEPLLEQVGLSAEGTRISGAVELKRDGDMYRLRTRLRGEGIVLRHRYLAGRRIGPFDGSLEADLGFSLGRSALRVHHVRAQTGALTLELKASLEPSNAGTRVAVDLTLPPLSCQDLLASLPRGFAPKLQGMAVQGKLGAAARLRVDTAHLQDTEVDLTLEPQTCRVLADPPAADVNSLKGEVTIAVSGPRGRSMQWPLGPSNPDWQPLQRISRNVRTAFVVAEDGKFYRHHGFDAEQLKRAVVINLERGRLMRGASTISQQLIKNVFLSQRRTLSRKFQEAVLTWRLEQVLPKRRILELYLNLVEMGPGVYGVAQAARHYFGRSARTLSPLQAAHLAALTPSPRHLGQRFRQGLDPGLAWSEKLRMLLRMMRRAGTISRAEQKQWSSASLSLLKR